MMFMNPNPNPQQAIRAPQFVGQWLSASNYQELLSLPIPLNGAPVLVSLTDEPTVYVLQMQGGQKVLTGYTITPLAGVSNNQKAEKTEASPDINERLGKIEEALAALKEAKGNEKSLATIP